jgi:hypothetical protein
MKILNRQQMKSVRRVGQVFLGVLVVVPFGLLLVLRTVLVLVDVGSHVSFN